MSIQQKFNTYITDAEWEVMRVVWANDRVTSKVISIAEKNGLDTIHYQTILGRLVGKGVLNTERRQKIYLHRQY